MIALLWANQIILGKKTYMNVPRLLKEQVAVVLTESRREDLVV